MSNIERILIDYLNNHDTKELAHTFETYMQSLGVRKADRRRDCSNTYLIDGNSTSWNRVECFYTKEVNPNYCYADFEIVMRKRAGYYLLIQSKGKRPFETDGKRILHYNKEHMEEIIKEYCGFFKMLTD